MGFYLGQKVVCINDSGRRKDLPSSTAFPKKGRVYTVRGLFNHYGLDMLYLEEVVNPPDESGFEPGAACRRFRPAVERKTDISIFTALSRPKQKSRETEAI